jgi:hypothetical protein
MRHTIGIIFNRALFFSVWAYLVFILGVVFFLWGWGDLTPGGVLVLFSPLWVLGAPIPILAILALCLRPRLLWPILCALGLFLFPIMQFFLPTGLLFKKNVPPPYMRVVSYNIGVFSRAPAAYSANDRRRGGPSGVQSGKGRSA